MDNSQGDLIEALKACETRVWDALVRGDMRADAEALDADFLGVYSDGFAGKAEHVQQLKDGATIHSYRLSECRVLPLGSDCAVFSYRADFCKTGTAAEEAMYVSSIWRRRGPGWINLFSQDTPATQ